MKSNYLNYQEQMNFICSDHVKFAYKVNGKVFKLLSSDLYVAKLKDL